MTAMSRDDGDSFQISVITEISGEVLGFRFPMSAMSRDDGDYGDFLPDFAQDSRHFNLAFTISRYNSAIDGGNADSAAFPMSKRGGQGKQQPMTSQAVLLPHQSSAQSHLVDLTVSAFSVAKDEVTHAIDGLINGSQLALLAVRKCEERLDNLDREMDQELATVITQVTPPHARELLACMKLMIDLERLGDLVASFAERSAIVRNRIDMDDIEQLTRMGCLLENMLATMIKAFAARNIEQALQVLRTDSEIDRLRNLIVVRHTE
ncbi:MAG TPA: PhoU domain-containing protein, partial [Candidatus Angelobacter sp.]|nr:PhoU domain-containing protein [Candidatus Angelobacter sp.]